MTPKFNNMKTIVLLTTLFSLALCDPAPAPASATESTSKADVKSVNAIPVAPQKAHTYYTMPATSGLLQQRPHFLQYYQRPYYQQQHQQPTMVIIAQPALVPQQMLYSQAAQQLLNYFHSNPQARYQFLHGNFNPQAAAHTAIVSQQAAPQLAAAQTAQIPYHAAPNYANYQLVPAASQVVSVPQHQAFGQNGYNLPASFYQQAQQTQTPSFDNFPGYSHAGSSIGGNQQFTSPLKTAPPIITGFENFTPEQQAQIKEQLSSHFGSQLTPLSGNSLQSSLPQFGAKLEAESASQQEDSKSQQSQQGSSQAQQAAFYRNQFAKA